MKFFKQYHLRYQQSFKSSGITVRVLYADFFSSDLLQIDGKAIATISSSIIIVKAIQGVPKKVTSTEISFFVVIRALLCL